MSNAEKRSVSTDALETLGTIITENEKRDAIHLAVDNYIAGHDMNPGDHVCIFPGKIAKHGMDPVGIVDPFLPKGHPKKDERFWLVVFPRKITALRHVWSHPDFEEEQKPEEKRVYTAEEEATIQAVINKLGESEQRLMEFAAEIGETYQDLMKRTQDFIEHGHYWSEGAKFMNTELPPKFWEYYEDVTSTRVKADKQHDFFSCSC